MPGKIEVLMPGGEARDTAGRAATEATRRLVTVKDKTIGIALNNWQCMRTIADELKKRLIGEHGVREVICLEVPTTLPMPAEVTVAASTRWDAAIVGLGN